MKQHNFMLAPKRNLFGSLVALLLALGILSVISPCVCGPVFACGTPSTSDDGSDGDPSEEDDDNCDPPGANDGPQGGGQPCPDSGSDTNEAPPMTIWRVSEPYINLWLEDTPVRYRMGSGQWMKFKITYKQRGDVRDPKVAGFGPNWQCNWIGMLATGQGGYITNFSTGGGARIHPNDGTRETISGARFISIGTIPASSSSESLISTRLLSGVASSTSGEGNDGGMVGREFPMHTKMEYKTRVVSEGREIHLLSRKLDRYGRFVNYGWTNETVNGQSIWRLLKVADKDGRECTLSYTNTSFPALITAVSDPYGRTARFFYDGTGRLKRIEDPIGIWSEFTYDGASGIVTNLNTPYGNTAFKYFEGSVGDYDLNRAIEVTEANGDKQLYAYRDCGHIGTQGAGGIYASDDGGIDDRNTYHWNRYQYQQISEQGRANYLDMPVEDYWKASLKHWLMTSIATTSVSEFCGAAAGPVLNPAQDLTRCNQIFYRYHGQTTPSIAGTIMRPVLTVRNGTSYVEGVTTAEASEYNVWGRPTTITQYKDGQAITYVQHYDDDGRRLLRVIGPRGELTRGYGYHSVITNLLTSVTNAESEVIRYTHNTANARLTSITYPSGLIVTNSYYSTGTWAGFLQMKADVGFATNYFTYTNGNLHIHTNELGLITTNIYDAINRVVAKHYPNGYSSNLWDKLDLVGVRDRLGAWTYYAYNSVRQTIAVTNANGAATQYHYCECGSPDQITRSDGQRVLTTTYGYDLAGRTVLAVYPDNYQLTYGYDGCSRLETITDSGGYQARFSYNDREQLAAIDVGLAGGTLLRHETRQYDEYGNLLRHVDRNGVVITNSYDFNGRMLERRIQDAGLERWEYGATGLTNYFDPLGEATRFFRDTRGRVLYQTNANLETLAFTYNPAGAMRTLEDGMKHITRWNRDQYGLVTNKIDALNSEMFRYQYDPEGRLTNRWQAGDVVTSYRFDPVGNLTNISYSGAVAMSPVTLKYDALNRLTNIIDEVGSTCFAWTNGVLLSSEDGPWPNDRIEIQYRGRFRSALSIQQENASPWVQNYGYDDYQRLAEIASPAGSFQMQYKSTTGEGLYTASSLVDYVGMPGGSYIQQFYDGIGRLLSTVLTTPQYGNVNSHTYEYNEGHQRTKQTFTAGNFIDYTYDKIGQLKSAKGTEEDGITARPHEQFGYAYDRALNLNYRTNNTLVQSFGNDSLNQLTILNRSGTVTIAGGVSTTPTSVLIKDNSNPAVPAAVFGDNTFARANVSLVDGNNTMVAVAEDGYGRRDTNSVTMYLPSSSNCSYDVRGNLTNDGWRVFGYDAENQLTSVMVPNIWRSEFAYDGLMRRRLRKEFMWSGGGWVQTNEVRYVYDGILVVQERHYASNGGMLLPIAAVTYTRGQDRSGTAQGAGGIGGLLARSERLTSPSSTTVAYYHSDGNGNVTALITPNGAVVAKYVYDPFGNILSMAGPLAEVNLYRFSSKEYHPNSGLVYYLYRYYEPKLQRWINRDPLQEHGGVNLAGFVRNRPILSVDPLGLAECADWGTYYPEPSGPYPFLRRGESLGVRNPMELFPSDYLVAPWSPAGNFAQGVAGLPALLSTSYSPEMGMPLGATLLQAFGYSDTPYPNRGECHYNCMGECPGHLTQTPEPPQQMPPPSFPQIPWNSGSVVNSPPTMAIYL